MQPEILLHIPARYQLHAFAAFLALGVGALQLWGLKKGSRAHKISGYLWVSAMMTVAIGSFWLQGLRMIGPFSPIHILSAVVIYRVPRAIWYAKKGQIDKHEKAMRDLYYFALIGALIFTFLPGRVMYKVLFGG